jgi:hypothetical protein
MSKHEVVFQGAEMIQKLEFFDENFEQPLAGDLVRSVNGAFKPSDITVF